jgi:hypothetical protein
LKSQESINLIRFLYSSRKAHMGDNWEVKSSLLAACHMVTPECAFVPPALLLYTHILSFEKTLLERGKLKIQMS